MSNLLKRTNFQLQEFKEEYPEAYTSYANKKLAEGFREHYNGLEYDSIIGDAKDLTSLLQGWYLHAAPNMEHQINKDAMSAVLCVIGMLQEVAKKLQPSRTIIGKEINELLIITKKGEIL